MKIVDQKNFLTGVFYCLFGLAFAWGAASYKIGTSTRMGVGFFPLIIAIGLAILGLILLISSLRPSADANRIADWSLKSVFLVLLSVVLFGVLIEPAGLIVTVPVLLICSAYAHPPISIRNIGLSIAVLLPMTWLIFIALLGLQIRLLPMVFYE